jgi:O-antigen biosynthesis rhamnosyltransferase
MRVLHFYKTYLPDSMGGVEQMIFQLCRNTARHGVDNHVLALAKDPRELHSIFAGHTVHRLKRDFQVASTDVSVSSFRKFAALAADSDLIHYHFPWPFADVVHFVTRARKPTVVTYHSDVVRQRHLLKLYRPLRGSFLGSMDRIVATSPNYLATSQVLHRYREKVRVIPIGLDKTTYPKATPELLSAWRRRLGDRFLFFVGNLRYYKGLHILLESLCGADYPTVIVGGGPIERQLHLRAQALGLQNVHFLGFLPDEDKVALLELCYAVVFPSHLRSEAFGITLLEGAMFGKPLISSEIGTGTSFINIHRSTGLVVPPGDPIALGDAIHELWENPTLAERLGKQAEARYWELFTAERMVARYADLYHELLGNRC